MGKDPAILLYTADLLVGMSTMQWEDRGKYITLLATMHQKGRMSEETIRFLVGSVSDELRGKFKVDEAGMWYNERLEEEAAKRGSFVESRRQNGRKGGRPKKVKEEDQDQVEKPKKKLPVKLRENENAGKNADGKSRDFMDMIFYSTPLSENLRKAWEEWVQYKKDQHSFRYKSYHTMEKAIRDLVRIAGSNEEKAIELLDRAMAKGWKGFDWPDKKAGKSVKDNAAKTSRAREITNQMLKDDEQSS